MPEMDYSKYSPFSYREGEWLDNSVDLANAILDGEETCPRQYNSTSWNASASGQIRLSYFTARVSETITKIRAATGDTGAAATPTQVRVGIYRVEANNDLTLVASTANDTTLFASSWSVYERTLSAPFNKEAGQRYAVGIFIITAFAPPTFHGPSSVHADIAAQPPRLCGSHTAASLVASIPAASVDNTGIQIYTQLLR